MNTRVDVDFWSCMVELDVERKLVLEGYAQRYCDDVNKLTGVFRKPTGFKITPWRSKDYRGSYYLFSMWGTGTKSFVIDRPLLHTNVTRVDLRKTYLDTFANFGEMADMTCSGYHGRKNVQRYNSRVREKTESRDRGGKGFAFGSLKSENRLSVYVPGISKELAIEVQFRGAKAIECASELLAVHEEYLSLKTGNFDTDVDLAGQTEAVWDVMCADITEECLGMNADEWAEQAHAISRETGLKIAEHHMRVASAFLQPDQPELPL